MGYPVGYSFAAFRSWALRQGTVYWNGYNQCVALAEAWGHNLRKSVIPCRYAYEMFANASPTQWQKIRNAPNIKPRDGDLVIWHERYGSAGHVAVAQTIGTSLIVIHSLDQNWSRYHRVSEENHHYSAENIIGWLRPR